jgi:hypothetical protein
MGREQRVLKRLCPRRRGEEMALLSALMLPVVLCCIVTAPLPAQPVEEAPELVLTDLWDSPHRLADICRGRSTVFFVCDTELSLCREGAVFFDARADEIEARGLRAALIFTGQPAAVRDFALRAEVYHSVYVDSDLRVFDTLLDKKILPALVLVDGEGRHVKTLYGGGESLEGNISIMIDNGADRYRRWWLILIPVVVIAVLPFVLS